MFENKELNVGSFLRVRGQSAIAVNIKNDGYKFVRDAMKSFNLPITPCQENQIIDNDKDTIRRREIAAKTKTKETIKINKQNVRNDNKDKSYSKNAYDTK